MGFKIFNKNKTKGLLGSALKSSGLTVSSRFLKDDVINSDFILGTIDDGVIMVDRGQLIHLFNKAAGEITGWAPNEAVGIDFNNIMPLTNHKGDLIRPEEHPFIQALAG